METYSTVLATCPACHAAREYGSELVGRYTYCQNCNARFYVEAPILGVARPKSPAVPPAEPRPDTTLDDLLRDSQQGQRYIIDSIRRQEANARLMRGLLIAALAIGLGNLAAIVYLLTRQIP